MHASLYGRGSAIACDVTTGTHSTAKHKDITDVEAVSVLSKDGKQLTVFAVNRLTGEDAAAEIKLEGFEGFILDSWQVLESDDMLVTNSADEERIAPASKTDYEYKDGILKATLKAASWNVIIFKKD